MKPKIMMDMRGFSLIEMAVVLFIVVLLLGSLLVPFTTQVEQRRITETQKTLEEIREALIGYAIINGRLPCPAASYSNGTGACSGVVAPGVYVGLLPWADLGVAKTDAWGRLFRYAVSQNYTNPIILPAPTRAITIKTRNGSGALNNLSNNIDIVAAIGSAGSNGYGAYLETGAKLPFPPVSLTSYLDEPANFLSGTIYARPVTRMSNGCNDDGTPLCEFDDIVVWLSPNVLINRMVSAQKLP